MIKKYEDLIICDLAETYNIYDYKSHPINRVAIFVYNLRPNSRLKMKLADTDVDLTEILLARLLDINSLLLWSKTKDGQKGINRPESVTEMITNKKKDTNYHKFKSGKDFEEMRRKIMKGG